MKKKKKSEKKKISKSENKTYSWHREPQKSLKPETLSYIQKELQPIGISAETINWPLIFTRLSIAKYNDRKNFSLVRGKINKQIRKYRGRLNLLKLLEADPNLSGIDLKPIIAKVEKLFDDFEDCKKKLNEKFPDTLPQFGIGKVGTDLSKQSLWNNPIKGLFDCLYPKLGKKDSTYKAIANILSLEYGYPNDPDLVRQRVQYLSKKNKPAN